MSNIIGDGDGNMYVKNRKSMENSLKDIVADGPIHEKNIEDFDELKVLQNEFNKQLQKYNQSIKNLIENSQDYISASNTANNRFANTYLKDPNGSVGYVTEKGVWKRIPNTSMGNSMQGKNGCPSDWSSAPTISPDDGQKVSLATASKGEFVKVGDEQLSRGTSTIMNQSCTSAGKNLYVTNPSQTTSRKFIQCSQSPGAYQTDLGATTLDACAKRAEDMGSNVFQIGENIGEGKGNCYIGGGGRPRNGGDCPNVPSVGRMGKIVNGKRVTRGSWWNRYTKWVSGYNTYATYETNGANNTDLGNTYYISDDLTKKKYPNNMITGYGKEFQQMPGYDSAGNDIISGSGLTLEQVKQKCLEIPESAGFYMNGNNYWIKNANMWPKGKRQYTGGDLYIRNSSVNNNNSCSKTVDFSQQNILSGYTNSGYMNENITCGLGTISKRDMKSVRGQYSKLNDILDQIHEKIVMLSREDMKLNKRLLVEYKLMKTNLSKYENTYKEIKSNNELVSHFNALEEDSQIQMLSYNQKYILWSMLALGVTVGAMKIMK